jgi:hypothetical protein
VRGFSSFFVLTGNNTFFFVVARTGTGFPCLVAILVGCLVLLNGYFIIVATAIFLAFSREANASTFVLAQ